MKPKAPGWVLGGAAVVVAVGLVVLVAVLSDDLGEAILGASTAVLAVATLAYVALTRQLVVTQTQQLRAVQEAAERSAVADLAQFVHARSWDDVERLRQRSFPLAAHDLKDENERERVLELEDEAFAELHRKLLAHLGPSLPTPLRDLVARLAETVRQAGEELRLISRAYSGRIATSPLEGNLGRTDDWSEVKSRYYLHLRKPTKHREWDDFADGQTLDAALELLEELRSSCQKRL